MAAFVLSLIMLSPFGALANNSLSDIQGHWAKEPIQQWIEKGYVKGYQDGTFKPNASITRAEFMTLANQAIGAKEKKAISFSDVNENHWFHGEVAKAHAAGYITGYADGTMKPNNQVSRQEVAVMLAKMAQLDVTAGATVSLSFKDQLRIPSWSKVAIGKVVGKKFMNGYPDETFQPTKAITRAEAIATLNKLLAGAEEKPAVDPAVTYDQAGTYGPVTGTVTLEGPVTIGNAGITLQNTVVNGNLVIPSSVSKGEISLKNVTVKGKTIIEGIARVSLEGNFQALEMVSPQAQVNLTSGSIASLTVKEGAKGSKINLSAGTSVKEMTFDDSATVTGQGTIELATVNSAGVTFETEPAAKKGSAISAPAGGAAPGGVVVTMPTASSLSLAGASFSGSGTELEVSVPKNTSIKYLDVNMNMSVEAKVVSIQNNPTLSSLLPTTTARVNAGEQSLNLISMLGIPDPDGKGISASSISQLLNGKDTGNITISLQLTKLKENGELDTTASTTYNLIVRVN